MKRVPFEIAKSIKEAGYPQKYGEGSLYYSERGETFFYDSELYEVYPKIYCTCPSWLDIWLWLWREKHIEIEVFIGLASEKLWTSQTCGHDFDDTYSDPEESIIAAIEYLIENKLLK